MICWSCEKQAGDGVTCAACGAIQPPEAGTDHFAVLGVPRLYAVDLGELEGRYKDLSRKLHPDRFAKADPRARRAALGRTVQLNEAWKVLRDPVKRAEYMLRLRGIDVGPEEGTTRTDGAGGKTRMPVPQELLMEILELREELADARAARDHEKVTRMGAAMRARADRAMAAVAAGLGTDGQDEAVARELVALRYYRRFLDEVEAHHEANGSEPANV